MRLDESVIRVYYKDHTKDPAFHVSREEADALAKTPWVKWNGARSRLRLSFGKYDPLPRESFDPLNNAYALLRRAPSLGVGARVMDKAAIEDSFYHQKIAEAWRSRDLSFPKQQTRAVNAGIAERKVDADPTKVATESAYSL